MAFQTVNYKKNTNNRNNNNNNRNNNNWRNSDNNINKSYGTEKHRQLELENTITPVLRDYPLSKFMEHIKNVMQTENVYVYAKMSMMIFVETDTNVEDNLVKFISCMNLVRNFVRNNQGWCNYTLYNDLAWSKSFTSASQKYRYMIAIFILQSAGFCIFDKNTKEIDGKNGENAIEALLARMKKTNIKHKITEEELYYRYDCLMMLSDKHIKLTVRNILNKISDNVPDRFLEEMNIVYIINPYCVIEEMACQLLKSTIKPRHDGVQDKFMNNIIKILEYLDKPLVKPNECYGRFFTECFKPNYFDKCTLFSTVEQIINSVTKGEDISKLWKSLSKKQYTLDKIQTNQKSKILLNIMKDKINMKDQNNVISDLDEKYLKNYAITLGNLASVDSEMIETYNYFVESCFDGSNKLGGLDFNIDSELKRNLGIYAVENSCFLTKKICMILINYCKNTTIITSLSTQIIRFLTKFIKPSIIIPLHINKIAFIEKCIRDDTVLSNIVVDQTVINSNNNNNNKNEKIKINTSKSMFNILSEINDDAGKNEDTKKNIFESDLDELKKKINELKSNYNGIITFLKEKYFIPERFNDDNDDVEDDSEIKCAKKIKKIIIEMKINTEMLEDAIDCASTDPIIELLKKALSCSSK